MLEGAFEVGPDLVFRPNLVSRVTIGRNAFTLTYQIRPQAHWNDGKQVSSADFAFTYRTFLNPATAEEGTREVYAKIRRFRELGPKTFVIELREPLANWRTLRPRPAAPRPGRRGHQRHLAQPHRQSENRPADRQRPLPRQRLEPGRRLIHIRNPSYWGPHTAHLDRQVMALHVQPRRPARAVAAERDRLRAHPAGLRSPPSSREARRIPGWRVVTWPALANEHLAFRLGPGGHPALRNRLVRQAIAYGIDRVEIARRADAALGARAKPLDSTVFLASEPFYRPNWSVYRYDPARARRLLEQAGCRRGADGVYLCAGERLRCASSPPPDARAASWRCSSCGRSSGRSASRSNRSTLRAAPSSARSCRAATSMPPCSAGA